MRGGARGLFPAGEGAGYAGGILSAGVDGIKTAEAVAMSILADVSAKDSQRDGAKSDCGAGRIATSLAETMTS